MQQLTTSSSRQKMSFNRHPPLGVNATIEPCRSLQRPAGFQWAPTLRGECYKMGQRQICVRRTLSCFNGHPPLGVNATLQHKSPRSTPQRTNQFQWAPTLRGECYWLTYKGTWVGAATFQWAPTLRGECYDYCRRRHYRSLQHGFQWAPTLRGECYLKKWSER